MYSKITATRWKLDLNRVSVDFRACKASFTLDLKSAYHQIKIRLKDRPYTTFQSGLELYQWKVMPFGLTNAVLAFQRVMNKFIDRYKLKGVNVYLDNITIGGIDQASHDENLNALKEAAKKEILLLMNPSANKIALKFNF